MTDKKKRTHTYVSIEERVFLDPSTSVKVLDQYLPKGTITKFWMNELWGHPSRKKYSVVYD